MSTRAQIIIKDGYDELWFYRHSDGSPESVKETLDRFCSWINTGRIRANTMQAAGWLVLIGAKEYEQYWGAKGKLKKKTAAQLLEPSIESSCTGWKVGAYEPCSPELHGDIAHLYVITLAKFHGALFGLAKWEEAKFDADAGIWTLGGKTYRTPKTFRSKEIK